MGRLYLGSSAYATPAYSVTNEFAFQSTQPSAAVITSDTVPVSATTLAMVQTWPNDLFPGHPIWIVANATRSIDIASINANITSIQVGVSRLTSADVIVTDPSPSSSLFPLSTGIQTGTWPINGSVNAAANLVTDHAAYKFFISNGSSMSTVNFAIDVGPDSWVQQDFLAGAADGLTREKLYLTATNDTYDTGTSTNFPFTNKKKLAAAAGSASTITASIAASLNAQTDDQGLPFAVFAGGGFTSSSDDGLPLGRATMISVDYSSAGSNIVHRGPHIGRTWVGRRGFQTLAGLLEGAYGNPVGGGYTFRTNVTGTGVKVWQDGRSWYGVDNVTAYVGDVPTLILGAYNASSMSAESVTVNVGDADSWWELPSGWVQTSDYTYESLVPDSTVTAGAWTTSAASLHAALAAPPRAFMDIGFNVWGINNATPANGTGTTTLEVGLSDPVDLPLAGETLKVWANGSNDVAASMTMSLYQGATLIQAGTPDNDPQGDRYLVLPVAAAAWASVTDWTDLRIRFTSTGTVQLDSAGLFYLSAALPDVPAAPTATPAADQVDLSWSAADGATTYNVYRDQGSGYVSIATGVATTSYSDTLTAPAVTVTATQTYKISAVNASGESAQSAASSAVAANPGPPTGVTATSGTVATLGGVNVSWTAKSYSATYDIYRSSELIDTGQSGTSYFVAGGGIGQSFSYTVRTRVTSPTTRVSGDSSASAEVTVWYTALVTEGAEAAGTTSATPTYPSSVAADVYALLVMNKPFGSTPTATGFASPGGTNTIASGSVANGSGTGSTRGTVLTKTAVGTESGTVTVSVASGSPTLAKMLLFRAASGYALSLTCDSGADTTETGTGISAVGSAANGTFDYGDRVFVCVAMKDEVPTLSAETFTAPGLAFFLLNKQTIDATATGNDGLLQVYEYMVSGTNTGVPTFTATSSVSGASSAAVNFLRVRPVVNASSKAVVARLAFGDAPRSLAVKKGVAIGRVTTGETPRVAAVKKLAVTGIVANGFFITLLRARIAAVTGLGVLGVALRDVAVKQVAWTQSGGAGIASAAAAKKIGRATASGAQGQAPQVVGVKVGKAVVSGALGVSSASAATKKATTTVVGAIGATGLSVAKKLIATTGLSNVGQGPAAVVRKVRAATAFSSHGTALNAVAAKASTAVSVTGSTPHGVAPTSVVQKTSKTAASAINGAAFQTLVRKLLPVTAIQRAAVAETDTAKKVGPASATTFTGQTGTVAAKKTVLASLRAAFAGTSTSNAVHRGRVVSAASVLASGLHNTLVQKRATVLAAVQSGEAPVNTVVRKTGTAAAISGIGGVLQNASKKVTKATGEQRVGVASNGISARLGKVVYAASAMASGLHAVVAKKNVTPTAVGTLSSSGTSSARKITVTTAFQRTGLAGILAATKKLSATAQMNGGTSTDSVVRKKLIAAAVGYVGHRSNSSTTAVAQIAVNVSQFMGGIQTAVIRKLSSITANQVTGVAETDTAAKVANASGLQATGGAETSAAKKINNATARITQGISSTTLILGRRVAAVFQAIGGTSTVTSRKTGIVSAFEEFGGAPSVTIRKTAIAIGQQVFGQAPIGIISTFRSAAATVRGLAGVAPQAIAKKVSTLTTTQFGDGAFGEGTFGFTGRTRGFLGGTVRVSLSQVQQVAATSRGYVGTVAQAMVTKVSKSTGRETAGISETGVARKNATINARAVQSATSRVSVKKVGLASVLATTGSRTTAAISKAIRWIAAIEFGQAPRGITSKKTTHTVTLPVPIGEKAQWAKRIGVTGRELMGPAEVVIVIVQKVGNISAREVTGHAGFAEAQKHGLATAVATTGSDVRTIVKKRLAAALEVATGSYQAAQASKKTAAIARVDTSSGTSLLARKVVAPVQEVAIGISHFVYPLFIGIFFGNDYLVETAELHTPWVFGELTTNWTAELSVAAWDIPTDVQTEYEFGELEPAWQMTEVFNT